MTIQFSPAISAFLNTNITNGMEIRLEGRYKINESLPGLYGLLQKLMIIIQAGKESLKLLNRQYLLYLPAL